MDGERSAAVWLSSMGRSFAHLVAQRFGDNIGALTEDRDGNFWLGTTGGALKITRHGFYHFRRG